MDMNATDTRSTKISSGSFIIEAAISIVVTQRVYCTSMKLLPRSPISNYVITSTPTTSKVKFHITTSPTQSWHESST
jgi:hypothetical protein